MEQGHGQGRLRRTMAAAVLAAVQKFCNHNDLERF
jgi:hypothetical protein